MPNPTPPSTSAMDAVLKCFALDGVALHDIGEDEIRAARAELAALRDQSWRFDGYQELCALVSEISREPFQASLRDAERLLRAAVAAERERMFGLLFHAVSRNHESSEGCTPCCEITEEIERAIRAAQEKT